MKRALPILTLILLVSIPVFAERVTSETAKKVAQTFLSNNGAKATQMNDLSQAAGFQNLYIFTAEEGFVVMSADDCVKPILGYSLTGSFKTEGMPENISSWLMDYDNQIQFAIENKLVASTEVAKQWKDLAEGKVKTTEIVSPLVQTQWDQNGTYDFDMTTFSFIFVDLYNNLCPYDNVAGELTVTGCVATAMAQVMKYWNFPSHGIGSHSYIPATRPEFGEQFADFGSTTYDWDNMPNALSPSSSDVEKLAVATLMYHCGVAMNMDYNISGNGGSAASSYYMPDRLYNNFGYKTSTYETKSSYSDSEWINKLKTELNASRPVEYNGRGSGGGHAFVCDGYDSDNNFHFNWGWSGSNDGFYSLTNLTPGSGGSGGGSYSFTNDQSAVFGIQPSTNNAAPTNLTYTLSGRDITLNWTGASGAVSYNVYRNGAIIGNTTGNTFNDVSPYGTNEYYVRSVNSADDLSLSSNSISITINYPVPTVNDLTASLSGNNASLSWTAPEWCYPETETIRLAYGEFESGTYYLFGWNPGEMEIYWGQRYLPSDLSGFSVTSNLAIYKVSFYAIATGAYEVHLYQGTNPSSSLGCEVPLTEIANKAITVSQLGWTEIDLDAPVAIDPTQDLWVFMFDPEKKGQIAPCVPFTDHNRGGYYSVNYGDGYYSISTYTACDEGMSFLIRTYLTDGTYTYNLYNDGVKIAENITGTSYSDVTLNNNAANQLIVKTNYYGGEAPSNMVGYTKGNATTASLEMGENDMMTVTENATLTVTGTASNDNAEHLVIENGAQLAHNSDGVKATVKKNIEGYSGEDGWYFITSPVAEATTPSAANGFLNGSIGSNTYDLYYYNEPSYLWMNYEAGAFNIEHKKGYLYANGEASGTTLTFAGTLTPSNSAVASNTLSYTADHLKGFNLIGNPFACNVTVDKDFYVIDNTTHEVVLAGAGTQIAPCEGVFVQASAAGQTATFSKDTSKERGANASMDFTISQGQRTLDRARVRFGEGETLEKFSLNNQGCQLSFSQNNLEYAVICTEQASEIPVNFKVTQNGTYTLNLEANALETAYLHLIDNLTGADIDLLTNPTYTFEANASDYASRFRLVFAANSDTEDNEWFAYYADGRIVVPNMNSDETLQIIDITGRMVQNNNLSNGVYVLRLVSGNDVKTQKIVIK